MSFRLVECLYKHYINHNQTSFTADVSISIRDLRRKKLFDSSAGSCHIFSVVTIAPEFTKISTNVFVLRDD